MKRLFLVLMVGAACSAALFTACKVEKEEPLFFETTAAAAYTFPAAEASATFTVSGNADWRVEVTEGRDRCTVTPAAGTGSATVTVRVAENPAYLQAQAMALRLTAGDYTKDIAVTQYAPPCPEFNPGAIAAAGQTVTIGSAPATINSTQDATGGDGQINYQWYKDGNAIEGATVAYYTPPTSDATATGVYTYTRRAKDNTCNPTLTPAVGSWVLTVVCPDFNPGAIATAGQTITIGGTPITIHSEQDATGSGNITYQWYKNNTAISGATEAYYTPPPADANVVSANTYTRRAKDNICNTTLTESVGSWVLTVIGVSLKITLSPQITKPVSCYGAADAEITITASGGTSPYQYRWDGTSVWSSSATLTGVSAGVHTIFVRDNVGNTASLSMFIPQPMMLTVTAQVTALPTGGNANGAIAITASGGSGNYTYKVNGISYPAAAVGGLREGSHTIEITDGNGCTATTTIYLGAVDVVVNKSVLNLQKGHVSETYTVRLTSAPQGDVTVGITDPNNLLTITPSSIVFTSGNWGEQEVGVTIAPGIGSPVGGVTYFTTRVQNRVVSAPNDVDYLNITREVIVNITDDDGLNCTDFESNIPLIAINGDFVNSPFAICTSDNNPYVLTTTINGTGITHRWLKDKFLEVSTAASYLLTESGTYTVTVMNANGCKAVSDPFVVHMETAPKVPCHAASTNTWSYGSQTWSDAIHIPACNKPSFTESYTDPHCRSYTSGTNTWYYYDWPYVNQNAATLCPSPWRVPTSSDFSTLVSATNYSTLINAWGYGGYAYGSYGSSMADVSMRAYYWSSTQYNTNDAYTLHYVSGGLNVTSVNKYYGFQVRCVK